MRKQRNQWNHSAGGRVYAAHSRARKVVHAAYLAATDRQLCFLDGFEVVQNSAGTGCHVCVTHRINNEQNCNRARMERAVIVDPLTTPKNIEIRKRALNLHYLFIALKAEYLRVLLGTNL